MWTSLRQAKPSQTHICVLHDRKKTVTRASTALWLMVGGGGSPTQLTLSRSRLWPSRLLLSHLHRLKMATVPELIPGDSGNCPIPQALSVLSIGPSLGQLHQGYSSLHCIHPDQGTVVGSNPLQPEWYWPESQDKPRQTGPSLSPFFLSPLGPTHYEKENRKGAEQKGQKRGKEVPTP